MGERAEVLAAYERCRAVLTEEFSTSPSEATRALAARLRAGEGARAPTPFGTQAAIVPVNHVPTIRRSVPLVGRRLAYPLHVNLLGDSSSVRVTCLLTEDIWIWTLQPHPDGCLVRIRVETPEGEETRLSYRRADVLASLPRLVSAAERAA